MPIYQYQCTECSHGLEALQKMSDPKLVDCPACNAATLKKQVTAAAFKLKGTGWYETDFKNSGKKPEPITHNDENGGKSTGATDDKKVAGEQTASSTGDSKSESSSASEGGGKSNVSAAE